MAGPRGYSSYRGRMPRWKIVLAIVLVLILLAACAFLFLQKFIVYDDTGAMRIELPWMQDKDDGSSSLPPEEEEDLEIVISEPEGKDLTELQGLQLSDGILNGDWTVATATLAANGQNAFAVTMKATGGKLLYDSKVEAAIACGAVEGNEQAMTALAGLIGEESYYSIARISCFHDSVYSNANMDGAGLKNTGGYIFYDGNNTQWLDPGKEGARTYLCDIVRECAEMGFDEILLTDFSYPTVGKLNKIDYGDGQQSEHLLTFLKEVSAVTEEYGVKLSVELTEETVLTGADEVSYQVLSDVVEIADRIYVEAEEEDVAALTAALAAVDDTVMLVPMVKTALQTGNYLQMPQ